MKKIFTKHFLLSSLAILGVMVLVLMPKVSHAQDAFGIVTGIVDSIYAIPAWAIYNGIIPALGLAVRTVGGMLDFGIQFSMNSMGILNDPSIAIGWKAIRDVCNLGFIFALIAIAISTILETTGWFSSYNAKKKLLTVIVAATLMNFSLYGTKVVIDVSNVAAQWFYDATLRLVPGESTDALTQNKSLSYALYSTLHFAKFYQNTDLKNQGVERFAVGIALIVLNLFAIKMLWGIAFLFIGRGITFVILLITSPIYVMGFVLPQLEKQQEKWIEELKTNAMLAPMFLLTLYVVFYFINSIYGPQSQLGQLANNSSGSLGTAFSYVDYIMFAIVYMLLEKCKEVAEEYSSETASKIGDTFKNGLGFVAGAVGVGTLGRAANLLSKNKALQNFAANSRVGEFALKQAGSIATKDFGMSGSMKDLKLDKVIGKDQFKDIAKGYKGKTDKEKKDAEEFAKKLGEGIGGEQNRIAYAERLAKKNIVEKVYDVGGNATGNVIAGATLLSIAGISNFPGVSKLPGMSKMNASTTDFKDTWANKNSTEGASVDIKKKAEEEMHKAAKKEAEKLLKDAKEAGGDNSIKKQEEVFENKSKEAEDKFKEQIIKNTERILELNIETRETNEEERVQKNLRNKIENLRNETDKLAKGTKERENKETEIRTQEKLLTQTENGVKSRITRVGQKIKLLNQGYTEREANIVLAFESELETLDRAISNATQERYPEIQKERVALINKFTEENLDAAEKYQRVHSEVKGGEDGKKTLKLTLKEAEEFENLRQKIKEEKKKIVKKINAKIPQESMQYDEYEELIKKGKEVEQKQKEAKKDKFEDKFIEAAEKEGGGKSEEKKPEEGNPKK